MRVVVGRTTRHATGNMVALMLFFLTGDIQTGKTRWLQAMLEELGEHGIEPFGVIAPGVWIEHREGDASGPIRYEKTGIDNLLLPDRQRIPFARRLDLAQEAGAYHAESQAARAKLAWAIDDEALGRVNAHLETMQGSLRKHRGEAPALLVVDELGQLELRFGGGLEAAVRLIGQGATEALPHAVVIVRRQLLEAAQERFAHASWNGMSAIGPNEEGRLAMLGAYGIGPER